MNKKGFTLIEVMVSIAIIAVLMSISFVAFSASRKTARDGRRKADLEQIRSALEMYRSDCVDYPNDLGTSIIGPGSIASCDSVVYMEAVPLDPSSPAYSYYYSKVSSNQYNLCAHLEYGGAIVPSGCDACANCNYKVTNP